MEIFQLSFNTLINFLKKEFKISLINFKTIHEWLIFHFPLSHSKNHQKPLNNHNHLVSDWIYSTLKINHLKNTHQFTQISENPSNLPGKRHSKKGSSAVSRWVYQLPITSTLFTSTQRTRENVYWIFCDAKNGSRNFLSFFVLVLFDLLEKIKFVK